MKLKMQFASSGVARVFAARSRQKTCRPLFFSNKFLLLLCNIQNGNASFSLSGQLGKIKKPSTTK